MSLRPRWLSIVAPACLVVTALSSGTVGAADKTKVDQATEKVEQGAKQIGQGKVGQGLKEVFTGIGHTIVEGAKFSGNTMTEFFQKTFSS